MFLLYGDHNVQQTIGNDSGPRPLVCIMEVSESTVGGSTVCMCALLIWDHSIKLNIKNVCDTLVCYFLSLPSLLILPQLFFYLWSCRYAKPISVAKRILEHSTLNMLVGSGATEFAMSQGFSMEDNHKLLSDMTSRAYEVCY